MDPIEVNAIRGLMSALGNRLRLDWSVQIVCRDGVAEIVSCSRRPADSAAVEEFVDIVSDAIRKLSIPVAFADDVGSSN